jgi:hypothetical protein
VRIDLRGGGGDNRIRALAQELVGHLFDHLSGQARATSGHVEAKRFPS